MKLTEEQHRWRFPDLHGAQPLGVWIIELIATGTGNDTWHAAKIACLAGSTTLAVAMHRWQHAAEHVFGVRPPKPLHAYRVRNQDTGQVIIL